MVRHTLKAILVRVGSSLVPRLSRNTNVYRGELARARARGRYLLRKHDVIEKAESQRFACFSTNYWYASTLGAYDIRRPIARVARYLRSFSYSESGYAHAQLSSLIPPSSSLHTRRFIPGSSYQALHTRLSTRLHNFCSPSGAWELGNEARWGLG